MATTSKETDMDSRSTKMRAALIGATLAIGALAATDSLAHCRSALAEQIASDVKADLAEWRRLIGNEEKGK
jgi:hypothetical protein